MPYKKQFKINNRTDGTLSPISGASAGGGNVFSNTSGSRRNYSSFLPDVYSGHPNRIERYNQMEQMDADPEVNGALDIIAEFCTLKHEDTDMSLNINEIEQLDQNENDILQKQLRNWYNIQRFDTRLFKLFRNVCKYGDQIFIRDPETYELNWVDMHKVTKIIVNESEGKEPEQYFIKDIDINFQNMTVTGNMAPDTFQRSPGYGGQVGAFSMPNSPYSGGSRFSQGDTESAIDAHHVVHISLTDGLDPNWPFGVSILETVFKTFKQKELLEDAILIYRIQRAPERRVFYIATGANMPPHLQMQFINRVKDEIHQRRIPSKTGGQENILDTTYNPLSINEDYFFPQPSDGNGSRVDTLPGGENLGQIDDLKFFSNKLLRGLKVPASYLPSGTEDGSQSYNDGRVATALMEEFRFNQYCMRLQRLIQDKIDKEFKIFLRARGYNIDNSSFEVNFSPPMNFAKYREIELHNSQIGNYSSLEGSSVMSKRFIMSKYLGLTDAEIKENERLLLEEMGETGAGTEGVSDMRSGGISPGDINSDLDMVDEFDENPASDDEFGLEDDLGDMDIDVGAETPEET